MVTKKKESAFIELRDISMIFPSGKAGREDNIVFIDLSMNIKKGELLTIFGPNGCGKTTILNIIAKIQEPSSGDLNRNGEGNEIDIGYVFQNHVDTLLPWRTVRGNIEFPLENKGLPKKERHRRVKEWMKHLALTEHANKYIYELSGGLKQLVAIARATVDNPDLLLLDEPFSALDYSTSRRLWIIFRRLWRRLGITTVFVSHNIDEAVFLGDRVYVLTKRPATIADEIKIPFGEDRELDLLAGESFFKTRSRVLRAFEGSYRE